jgi:hypothetical protein
VSCGSVGRSGLENMALYIAVITDYPVLANSR